jgi:Tfp pilus assembly protein PilX
MTTTRRIRWSRQRGGVTLLLIMVLIVLAALVGVLAVRGATSDLQMASSQRVSRRGFYCAEAALSYARAQAGAHQTDWSAILLNGNAGSTSTWYPTSAGVAVDVDGDGQTDAWVVMTDNVDGDNDIHHDNDLTVILTSTCNSSTLESTGATRTLAQIVTYGGGLPTDYRFQAGHSSSHSGNEN